MVHKKIYLFNNLDLFLLSTFSVMYEFLLPNFQIQLL